MTKIQRLSSDVLNETGLFVHGRKILNKKNDCTLHWHEFYEIEYITRGHGQVVINDETYPLAPGTLLFLTPVDFEMLDMYEEIELVNIAFSDNLILSKVAVALTRGAVLFDFPDTLFQLLCGELPQKDSWSTDMAQQLLNCILMEIARKIRANSTAPPIEQSPGRQAIRFIQMHFREPITLKEVSLHVGLSPNYFSTLFHQTMNMSFKTYLTKLRLNYAAKALSLTDSSISDICFISGFNDFANFSRAFKNQYHLSPTQYKQKKLEKQGLDGTEEQ